MRLCATRLGFSRVVLGLLCTIPAFVASVNAQVAGRNVNMVTGGTFPGGDPFLQKQNEPSIALSTRNPCHLLAGANDYRAVNLQFPAGSADDKELGDAWLGWYESTDCGATWYSTLVPGYRQDTSIEGTSSPVYGLSAGADPVVRSGAAGTFYYLFIAFNRGSNVGKLALARAIDHNDRDAFINPDKVLIDPDGKNNRRRALSPIQYAGTTEIARGSSGQFVDKPSLTVFPAATGTCTIDGETVPATNVYTAWTEFVGNSPDNFRSKVYFARSADCGKTLAGPASKLSEGYPIGQGTAIAVNPNNPDDIYVVWRQIRNDRGKDALLFARSIDGGRSFSRAAFVPGFGEGQFAPFDQNTTSTARGSSTTTFRTVAYPSLAFADDGFLYLAVSQVPAPWSGGLGGAQARITMTRTAGEFWETPTNVVTLDANGQQFMPALAYSAGRLQLVWYDVRFDEAKLNASALINEKEALGPAAPNSPPPPKIRRTIDLLGAQATIQAGGVFAWPLEFQPYGVSQPDYNDISNGARVQRGPRISQYLIGDPAPPSKPQDPQYDGIGPRQMAFNRANLLLYGGGTIPFMGDYIDVGGIPWVLQNGRWVLNGKANLNNPALGTFHAAWTDNRDAGVGKATTTALPDGSSRVDYLPPLPLPPGSTLENTQCPAPGVDNTRTRDANVYTSRITQDFSLTVPVNARQTNTPGVVRAFAVQLANNLPLVPGPDQTPASFRLTVTHNGASFSRGTFLGMPQSGNNGCVLASPTVHQIDVDIYPRSSVTRTVYVTCGSAGGGPVVVTATRMAPGNPPTPGPAASVVINVDPTNPSAKGADGQLLGPETRNPDAENPDAENPDAENPDAENPDAENPDAENPDAENPDAENPDAENSNFQDVTTDITNTGNTTSGYQVVVNTGDSTAGYAFQLLANRVYSTPTSINCHLVKQNSNQQLFAIPLSGDDLDGTFFDENSGDVRNATVLIRPGETVRVKLRIVWDSNVITKPFCEPGKCHDKLQFRTRALAPNTGATTPEEDSLGNVNNAFLSFVSEPTNSSTTSTLGGNEGPIRVRAVDATGAAISGLQITMALGSNPGATELGGTVTQLTDTAGNAVFNTLTLDTSGVAYTLVASAPGAGSVDSNAFDVFASVGTVSDASGDAGGGPDLTSATLTVDQGDLRISVRYATGTFSSTSTIVNLVLDIDENPATGSPGVDSGCSNDSSIMGTDFIINSGGAIYGSNVFVFPYVNQAAEGQSCNTYAASSNVGTSTVVTNGVDFVISLSALGNDSGRLKFKVLSATSIPNPQCPTCSTSVQDYMPNVGFAPGQVPTPIIF
ncbi:MAG TPA: hypothetical protein VNJ02_12780 [Vicinamibacterales bacterium]|nr:hypothetical protein [Vicinamibacterales bacterium]